MTRTSSRLSSRLAYFAVQVPHVIARKDDPQHPIVIYKVEGVYTKEAMARAKAAFIDGARVVRQ